MDFAICVEDISNLGVVRDLSWVVPSWGAKCLGQWSLVIAVLMNQSSKLHLQVISLLVAEYC